MKIDKSKFTKEKPTEPGYYLWHGNNILGMELVRVKRYTNTDPGCRFALADGESYLGITKQRGKRVADRGGYWMKVDIV